METQFMVKKKTEVPPELLSKEFLKQFKTEEDVSKFLKDLHSQVLEQMLQGGMDAHFGYEKNDVVGVRLQMKVHQFGFSNKVLFEQI